MNLHSRLAVRLTLITQNTFADSELVKDTPHTARSCCHNRKRAINCTIFICILTKLLEHSTPRQTYKLPLTLAPISANSNIRYRT